jgi:hypothetical protein
MILFGEPPEKFERPPNLFPGAKVKFYKEVKPYRVRCTSKRYTICTKPFNPRHTVLYTIIDWQKQQRGPSDLIFGSPTETDAECLQLLVELLDGETALSSRRSIWLDIEKLWHDDHIMIGEGAETEKEWFARHGIGTKS